MCGIHGFINGGIKDRDISSFISDGFVAGSLRGMDSSGIAVIDPTRTEYCAQKLPVQGSMFITDRYAKQLIDTSSEKDAITICHTRAATSGRIGINQAHPFCMENEENDRIMVGVHNGTLTGWSLKENGKDYTVDSEWALNRIYEKGLDAFKDINGAFVFVWWDSDDSDVLNFALNDQRTMYVAFTKAGGMAFASEPGMLYWLLERNKLYVDGQLLQLSSGTHYRFDLNDLRNPAKQKLPEAVTYNYHGTSYTRNNSYYARTTNMEAVGSVFTAYANKSTAANDGVATTNPNQGRSYVTVDEVQTAKELGLHCIKGVFVPFWADEQEDIIFGSFYPNEFDEMEAVIRGASHIQFGVNVEWNVVALGVVDEDGKITAVCSKPRLGLAQEQAA